MISLRLMEDGAKNRSENYKLVINEEYKSTLLMQYLMKFLLTFLSLTVYFRTFAGPQESLTLWLDSAVQKQNIEWADVRSDFQNYTKNNYILSKSVSFLLHQIKSNKSYEGNEAFLLDQANNYPNFESLGKASPTILKEFEVYLLSQIIKYESYKEQNLYTYFWIYIQHLNSRPINDKTPDLLSAEIRKIETFANGETELFEKICFLILSRKIFVENDYKSAYEVVDQLPKTSAIYISKKEAKLKYWDENSGDENSQTFAEVEPLFIGGYENLSTFLMLNIVYPKKAILSGQKGMVYVRFIIDLDGSVTDIKIIKGAKTLLAEEAYRVVSMMPKWIPGMQNNKNVKVVFRLPIHFSLG